MITQFFQVPPDLKYLQEIDDDATMRQFIRQLLLPEPPTTPLTSEQCYLRCLMEMPATAMDAWRAANRLIAARPRQHSTRASVTLTTAARDLALEAYHFQERMKVHLSSARKIFISPENVPAYQTKLTRVIKAYQKANDRLLRHRNFIVHGPTGRRDEFADLRLVELSAMVLHPDLWFEYDHIFKEYKDEWSKIARDLIRSIESSLAMIQSVNENAIAGRHLTFAAVA